MAHLPRLTEDGDISFVDEEGRTHLNDTILSYRTVSGGVQEVTPRFSLPVVDTWLEISSGRRQGTSCINKFGAATVAGASREAIWDGANLTGITDYTYMAAASTLYISSDAAGDGQVYEVQGLDGNYAKKTVNVTASGLTFVALTGTWIRVFRVKNMGATDNAGNIYISDDNTDTGGGADGIPDTLTNVKAMIQIGHNQTLMSIYTVPAGTTAYMTRWTATTAKGDDVELTLWARSFGGVFRIQDHHHVYQQQMTKEYHPYVKYEEKTDIEMKGLIGAATGDIGAGFDLILEEN